MNGFPLTEDQLVTLTRSLNKDRIAERKQGNTTLSYLEAWDVKATLIRVFGFGGFSADADECEILKIENNVPKTKGYGESKQVLPIEYDTDGQIKFGSANFRVTAKVRVRLHIHQLGATYTEYAVASQTGPDLGEVSDFAVKTAESDALKRAAIYLGTQFGLSLYDDGNLRDVVKHIVAPGQEMRAGVLKSQAERREREQREQQQAPAGQTPAEGEEPTAHEELDRLAAEARREGVTDAQHEENKRLLERGLAARAIKEDGQPADEQ